MRFLSVLAIRTDFNSGCSGHKKANLRRADVSYFLPLLLAEKEIGDVYRKATWSLSNAKIVLYLVVLIQLSDDYHPRPFSHRSAPETFSELFAVWKKGEVTFRVGRSDHRNYICMRSQALAAVAQRKNHDEWTKTANLKSTFYTTINS